MLSGSALGKKRLGRSEGDLKVPAQLSFRGGLTLRGLFANRLNKWSLTKLLCLFPDLEAL